jgi:hypothetical protein
MRTALGLTLLAPALALADSGNGVSAGLILSQDTSARAAALAGSVNALGDDVAAFGYNPASLGSLTSNHAVVAYQRGLVDDNFSQVELGLPLSNSSVGFSLSMYQGGQMDFIMGSTRKSVTSQRDIAAGLGYAYNFPNVSLGATAKYLSSELVETEKATALGLDLGGAVDVGQRLRIGAAYQNLGAELKYANDESDVEQIARLGAAVVLVPSGHRTLLLVDFPYLIHESRVDAAVGLDTTLGPIALRFGYRTGIELGGFTAGTGLALKAFSLDYAFGLIRDLDSTHRVSLSYRFGSRTEGAPKADVFPHFPPNKKPAQTMEPAPQLPKPAKPVPVFQGPGRGEDCADEKSDSSVIFYGKGRSKCK